MPSKNSPEEHIPFVQSNQLEEKSSRISVEVIINKKKLNLCYLAHHRVLKPLTAFADNPMMKLGTVTIIK